MPLNEYPGRNRTAYDSGVRMDGILFASDPIVGTGVTPEQAAALAAPLMQLLQQIPYDIDSSGQLATATSTYTLTHLAELTYAPNHPVEAKRGQPINAEFIDGDFITKYGGAPMPFNDMDNIAPNTLAMLLVILNGMLVQMLTAT